MPGVCGLCIGLWVVHCTLYCSMHVWTKTACIHLGTVLAWHHVACTMTHFHSHLISCPSSLHLNPHNPSLTMTTLPTYQIPAAITTALSTSPTHRTVLMTCGISGTSPPQKSKSQILKPNHSNIGSGKSTLSHALTSLYPSFTRLSIDKYIFSHHGIYAVDYPISEYEALQNEAEAALKEELRVLLREGTRNLVLDFSFWCRGWRDEYRELVMKCGGGKYRGEFSLFLLRRGD